MKTALKRIIAAVAVFGALSALCYSCAPVRVCAEDQDGDFNDTIDWTLNYITDIANEYNQTIMPAYVVQNVNAAAFAITMYTAKSVSAAYEPEFHPYITELVAGFYYDADNNIHVTTFFCGSGRETEKTRFLVAASDEHFTMLEGLYPLGDNPAGYVTGYGLQDYGNNTTKGYSWTLNTYFKHASFKWGFKAINDTGDTFTTYDSASVLSVDLTRPATVCTAFPPTDFSSWGGYLPIPQPDGTTIKITPGKMPVKSADFTASDENFRNIVNNYIVQYYPDSDFQVPETIPDSSIETLPNDEYSGLPAGWNEINPVPMPDIQTPSAPLTEAEIENAHDWLTDFSFWASVQSGLAFWFAAASHAAEINETVTELLLGMSLLAVLGYVIWRWGI